jgi:xanthine/uracil permease
MKKALVTFAQFLLFLGVFAVGSLLNPFHMHWALVSASPSVERYFVPDGLLLAIGVFLAIVILQAIRKRMCDTTYTVIAFLLAVAIGYAMKFGFVTHDLF